MHRLIQNSYTFWIGASLGILGYSDLINREALRAFIARAHHPNIGGYGKFEKCVPDLLHSYMSMAGINLLLENHDDHDGDGVMCELNIKKRHVPRMKDNF